MKAVTKFLIVILFHNLTVLGQKIPIPENYSIIDTVSGDLDKDGIDELVVAYNTKKENNDSFESIPIDIIIYKKEQNQWKVWKKSRQALYGSRDGGMMGDPFGDLKIERGILQISQDGGSSWKWGKTDKYRYQDGEFYLVGYTSLYGKLCEYWVNVDFNLSTGKMIVNKEYENCKTVQEIYKRENETLYRKDVRITLQNRSEKEIKIVTPKYHHEIYIATKSE